MSGEVCAGTGAGTGSCPGTGAGTSTTAEGTIRVHGFSRQSRSRSSTHNTGTGPSTCTGNATGAEGIARVSTGTGSMAGLVHRTSSDPLRGTGAGAGGGIRGYLPT